MAYRPKPAMAAWIQGERKRLGLSTKQLAERLALIGVTVGEQTISVWESYAGRNPSADNLDALERIYGSQAPSEQAGGESDLAAAIREQTAALMGAIAARDSVIQALLETNAGLLQELRDYRKQTVARQSVEQSLIAALPGALATALAAMRADDPVPDTLEVRPQRA